MQQIVRNMPDQDTPFVGREEEVAGIAASLADPGCRLITLAGPGGIGKTRLAGQVGLQLSHTFPHGIYFAALQPIISTQLIASAIADSLRLPLPGQEDTTAQLLHYLADKQLLLILDNFEHLLDGVDVVGDILRAAPGVKLLITSREVLNLRQEWVWPVRGMAYPHADHDVTRPEEWSAVHLFVECARRVSPGFASAGEFAEASRICRLVEGTPLAIELAASWLKVLTCKEIAAEIQQNLDFLRTGLRNVPARHRSMHAVFEQSLKLMAPQEREVFSRLAVFRGGFRREAAEQVAGATLPLLSALVDKSLIRREPSGRYQMHELLRQYAERRLTADPAQVDLVLDRHRSYYATFLSTLAEQATGARQREVMREIAADLENIRAAWGRAVQQANIPDIERAAYTFYQFTDFQSRFQEGAAALEQAVAALEQAEPSGQRDSTLATLLAFLGYHYIRLGRYEPARHVFERSREIWRDLEATPPPGFGTDPLAGLALLLDVLGDYEGALALAQESSERSVERADKLNLTIARYVQASAAFALGRYDAAGLFARQAYDVTEETSNRWMMGNLFVLSGNIARALGDYEQARTYYQASHKIKLEFDDLEGVAFALLCLARITWLQQDHEEAAGLFRQSNEIYHQINDSGGLASSLCGLGDTALATGDLASARGYLLQALQIAVAISWVPLVLLIFSSSAELLLKSGQPEQAVELLVLVTTHPASDLLTRAEAERLLAYAASIMQPATLQRALAHGKAASVEDAANMAREYLRQAPGQSDLARLTGGRRQTVQPLIEPLSERELQVLRLLTAGLTNEQIALKLDLVVGTVKAHNHNIFGKLSVRNRSAAIARARELELL